MRDQITGETYGAGFILNGEPTGDETPLDTYQPEYAAHYCAACDTTTFGRARCDCGAEALPFVATCRDCAEPLTAADPYVGAERCTGCAHAYAWANAA